MIAAPLSPGQLAAWRALWQILLQPDDDPALAADMSAADEGRISPAADDAPGTAAHQAAIAPTYAAPRGRRKRQTAPREAR